MQLSEATMLVNVLYFGHLREATLKEKETLEVPSEATLATLIELLEQKYGPEYRNAMDAIKGLRILIDGRDSSILGGTDAPLKEGCTVVFLPPIAGG
ncbi:molybdopterin converting factor subunit 1 [Coprothermobacter proteolyticus DSM 5265]|uniref:Molybdopterin converting factor subunit 1 n=1 Tax=Coprothermobacter proteolyticus (strain ATCC 35245 / DSM 5265 / OCM 4 / BT) TaxID=309798 RepID=B5Y6N3_COPPD|nr:MoaD/ThiS family protein [Coprothermobacter proteolyticus]ACI17493.1 molybdopterin converting factor subunit 1 [Coprothermobacter proteolyticus DSM 5265]